MYAWFCTNQVNDSVAKSLILWDIQCTKNVSDWNDKFHLVTYKFALLSMASVQQQIKILLEGQDPPIETLCTWAIHDEGFRSLENATPVRNELPRLANYLY